MDHINCGPHMHSIISGAPMIPNHYKVENHLSCSFCMRSTMLSSMTTSATLAFFVCFLVTIANFHVCFCNGITSSSHQTHNTTCFQNEREALVKFKQDLNDSSNRLSSWAMGEDCCKWTGVVCDNFTGHVREIRLRNPYDGRDLFEDDAEYELQLRNKLRGKVNPALLDLKYLQYLDLSSNDFEGISIPSFIGSIATLRYLNLSWAGFSGTIPPQLGNITAMRYLDLNQVGGPLCQNLQWLSRLVSLQHVAMGGVDLSEALDWLQVTSNLPSLVELRLSDCQLKYVVSPSSTYKINFTSLEILDLSSNSYLGSSVQHWISSLNHVVSLNLKRSSAGPIPTGVQNMTSLRVLDYSYNSVNSTIPNWLYSLSHLESLNLQGNHLHGAVSMAIGNLTSLVELDLSVNQLRGSIPTSLGKLCKLKTIGLLGNEFSGEVANIFIGFSRCKSCRLETFDFSQNHFLGHLPYELGQLTSLVSISLCFNSFFGPIPASIGRLSSLKGLSLNDNKFNGTLPESLGLLGNLEVLNVNNNLLEGVVSDVHFANLTRLSNLVAHGNRLTLNASENWVPPFQLEALSLDSWKLGPQFPLWLSSQTKLKYLSIANTRISDSFPNMFWASFSQLYSADLSRNQIRGEISSIPLPVCSFLQIDLSSNLFNGSIPLIPQKFTRLDLSNNSFSGSLHQMLCDKGKEPNIVLNQLNLGHNRLSGIIPDCWKHWQGLVSIRLENNNLEGRIPKSITQLPYLVSLHLRHNHLTGELPQRPQNCSSLLIIDLGENKLTGAIPWWIGNALLGLQILNLRSNNLSGNLPHELCRLSSLQILDVAHNNLFGPVPRCFANFSAMAKISNSSDGINWSSNTSSGRFFGTIYDNAILVTKGRDVEYSTSILGLVNSMDLSGNSLSGEIPEEITKLVGLGSLNMSGNHLTGRIPRNIGDMRQLESLDFSLNQLSGEIPSSMSSLTFLSHLNLSYNNLTGTIPSSTQLQSMDGSSFVGNKLCGPPLNSCFPNQTILPNVDRQGSEEEDGEGFSDALFYASIALGFAVGFWIVLGPLLFKRSWRITYFRAIEDTWYKLSDFIFECRYIFRR